MFDAQLISKIDDLYAISSEWEQLLKESLYNSYSLSWDWISEFISTYIDRKNQLFCITVYNDKKQLVGIAPFWIDFKRQFPFGYKKTLRFLGSKEVCSDHLDLIIHRKNSEKIIEIIWDHLFTTYKKKWDIWEYFAVSVNSNILQSLRKLSDNDSRCIGVRINEYSVCPFVNLPDSWESYLESLSANQRRALKVSTNAISDLGKMTIKFCESIDELPLFMNTHIRLHRKSWNERGMSGSFGTECFRKFHYGYAEKQLEKYNLFLCTLELNDIPIGSFYGFVYNKTLLYYLIGINRSAVPTASIGRVLLAYCIKEAIRRGYDTFDFLRGSESYKYDWTDLEQRELFVTFYNRSFGALAYILKQFVSSFCRQCGYVLLGEKVKNLKLFSHLTPKQS
ncbi:MAG: GNAT family N-acetyltransferase [Crenarchaeota archaeon]|nr:GNAT family N-acetyltransferase [Thermoproteota archaeon]